MTADVRLRTDRRDGVTVVGILGEVDPSNADTVLERVVSAPTRNDRGLVVDLTECSFIDSAGIAMLFEVIRRHRRRRVGVAVVAPPEAVVRRVLEITRVDAVAPLCPDVQTAELAAVTEGGQ